MPARRVLVGTGSKGRFKHYSIQRKVFLALLLRLARACADFPGAVPRATGGAWWPRVRRAQCPSAMARFLPGFFVETAIYPQVEI
jgi:hypothetical protein